MTRRRGQSLAEYLVVVGVSAALLLVVVVRTEPSGPRRDTSVEASEGEVVLEDEVVVDDPE